MIKLGAKATQIRRLIVAMLSVVVLASTAVSFAYWRSGVDSAERNNNLNITIGTGETISSQITLSSISDGRKLIPYSVTPDVDRNETQEIVFTITVSWVLAEPLGGTAYSASGILNVSLYDVVVSYIDGAATLQEDKNLFWNEVSIEQDSTAITGYQSANPGGQTKAESSVNVTVKVKMKEPNSREQYERIAGRNVAIVLKFTVTSDYDTKNP